MNARSKNHVSTSISRNVPPTTIDIPMPACKKPKEKLVLYLCDRRKCEQCKPECKYTTDITHAKNFEVNEIGELSEKEIDSRRRCASDAAESRAVAANHSVGRTNKPKASTKMRLRGCYYCGNISAESEFVQPISTKCPICNKDGTLQIGMYKAEPSEVDWEIRAESLW